MSAKHPKRRKMTARESAQQLGVSPRTIQRFMAEPREEFERRAQEKRRQVSQLRAEGKKYKEIAEIMNISIGTVGRIIHEIRKKDEKRALEQDKISTQVS